MSVNINMSSAFADLDVVYNIMELHILNTRWGSTINLNPKYFIFTNAIDRNLHFCFLKYFLPFSLFFNKQKRFPPTLIF